MPAKTAEWGKEAKPLLSVSEGAEPGIKTVNVLAVDANGVPCLDSKTAGGQNAVAVSAEGLETEVISFAKNR